MDQLETMQIFVRVAELASFTQAAEHMGIPKASISAAVQRLEGQLGTRLLHRTTRRVQVTHDGQAFYERCKDMLADMEELQTMFQLGQAELEGRLRVDMPMAVVRDLILPRLPEFLRAHPKLEVELSGTDRRVDLVREGFDCVLRAGVLTDSSLIARPLGYYRLINCASPQYLAEYGVPQTLDELAQHRLIHYVSTLGTKSLGFEYYDAAAGGEAKFISMPGVLTVNNSDSYRAACLAGLGLIQVPELGVRSALEQGELVQVLPQYRACPMPVNLLYANRRHLPKRFQSFMNWVAEIVQPHLVSG